MQLEKQLVVTGSQLQDARTHVGRHDLALQVLEKDIADAQVLCICIYTCVFRYVCMYLHVCIYVYLLYNHTHTHTHTHTHAHTHVCMYVSACMYICISVI